MFFRSGPKQFIHFRKMFLTKGCFLQTPGPFVFTVHNSNIQPDLQRNGNKKPDTRRIRMIRFFSDFGNPAIHEIFSGGHVAFRPLVTRILALSMISKSIKITCTWQVLILGSNPFKLSYQSPQFRKMQYIKSMSEPCLPTKPTTFEKLCQPLFSGKRNSSCPLGS